MIALLNKLKSIILIFLMASAWLTGRCQDPELVDSLKQMLANAETDNDRLYFLNRLTWVHISNQTHIAAQYNAEARALGLAINDEGNVARTYHYAGLINRFLGNYEEAIIDLKTALVYFEANEIHAGASGALFNLGVVHSLVGNYDQSLEYYYRQIALDESRGDTIGVANTLNSIGSVHRKMGKYAEALDKYEEARKILVNGSSPWNLANVLSNIGGVHFDQGEFTQAKSYFAEALVIDREINDTWGIAYNLHRLGAAYDETGKPDSAAIYLEEALVLRRELDQKLELAETMVALGSAWFSAGERNKGTALINEGLELGESINAFETQTSAHLKLANLYRTAGDYNLAFKHLEKYASLRDTVLNKEKLSIAADMEARYESAKKDELLAVNELEIASAKAAMERQKAQFQIGMVGAGAIVIILILLVIVFNERRKRNAHQVAGLQKEKELVSLKSVLLGEEKERSRIARDLHDGLSSLLAAIKIQFNSLQHESEDFRAHEKFKLALRSLDQASTEVRRIAHNMMPELLMKYGLVEALSEFITSLNVTGRRQIQFTHYGLDERLSPNTELIIYRIIQELLNNIVRHSRATEVLVQINRRDQQLTITVEDNGVGFDAKALSESGGIGMDNLTSRVNYLGGELQIESLPEQGTSAYINIDLDKIPPES